VFQVCQSFDILADDEARAKERAGFLSRVVVNTGSIGSRCDLNFIHSARSGAEYGYG